MENVGHKNQNKTNIIEYYQGNYIKVDLFDKEAQNWAKEIARDEKKMGYSQVRKFYDELLRIQESIEREILSDPHNDSHKRNVYLKYLPEIRMLKAKAYYSINRKNIKMSRKFYDFIRYNIDYVTKDIEKYTDDIIEKSLKKFEIFVKFFESVVAYLRGELNRD